MALSRAFSTRSATMTRPDDGPAAPAGAKEVRAAMASLPRADFVPAEIAAHAGEDEALPIGCGQTISQPSLVAEMTRALEILPTSSVIEIGTGSGWQAAILGRLAGRVVTIERHAPLARSAAARLRRLGLANVEVRVGDGALGAPDAAPFDRVLVTAAARELPRALVDQLEEGGVLIAPVGPPEGVQTLVRLRKDAAGTRTERLDLVRFVPLVAGLADEEEPGGG